MNLFTNVSTHHEDSLIAALNQEQQAAVVHSIGPMLVLAGAGSGKTRVIIHRIAWLIQRQGVAPWRILAVTFTNKAAGEMRERLVNLLGPMASDIHVSTFHAAGASILRREAEKLERTRSFVIYDDADQLQIIRRAIQELGWEGKYKPQQLRNRINEAKNQGLGPNEVVVDGHPLNQAVKEMYFAYEKMLKNANAFDFGDLILQVVALFRKDKETLERYRNRFQYILVDEFQDTNSVQYELLRLLAPDENANVCVVGDDDQSIYRWRGADITNILSFDRDYPRAKIIKLERNYRSDSGILEAAYEVIRKNPRRKEKKLWTERPRGDPFGLFLAANERDEARQIAFAIKELSQNGISYSDIAVFFRVNAQSRVLEEGMRLAGIPYRLVRGRAFYDRAEIKDAAAYLRLAVNPFSDADLERVINRPTRGIGQTTVLRLHEHAQKAGWSLYETVSNAELISNLQPSARKKLRAFHELLQQMSGEIAQATTAQEAVEKIMHSSGLVISYEEEGSEESLERAENLRELRGAAAEFDRLEGKNLQIRTENTEGSLAPPQSASEAFLEKMSLVGDNDQGGEEGRVSLMTLHAAKGLEFEAVFMTGMEENVFPHSRALSSLFETEEMEEERRLCYVGITRAKRKLHFSATFSRSLFGELRTNPVSRFLSDIPKELFGFSAASKSKPSVQPRDDHRIGKDPYVERVGISQSSANIFDDDFDQRPPTEKKPPSPAERRKRSEPGKTVVSIVPGARVHHSKFGEGRVMACDGKGCNAKVTVLFPKVGEVRIVARFLQLMDDEV